MQKYLFAGRSVKAGAHSALNLRQFYVELLKIAWDYTSQSGGNRRMAHMLSYCQIVSESYHSAKLEAMLVQADKTQPLPEKSRIRI